jgi:hypothetical protein
MKIRMTLTKEKILESLKNSPKEFEMDDFLEGLFLIEKIEKSREQARNI